jgi:hypothetical protein
VSVELRPGERDHESEVANHSSRYSTNSTSAIGPLDVLEQQDDRVALGHPLEEHPPAGEQIFSVRRGAVRPSSC